MIPKRPMLAVAMELDDITDVSGLWVQPKYDGVRCLVYSGVAYSRSLKPLPNKEIQRWASLISLPEDAFIDGEILATVGDREAYFEETTGAVMSETSGLLLTYVMFDYVQGGVEQPFSHRLASLEQIEDQIPSTGNVDVMLTAGIRITSFDQLKKTYTDWTEIGYEGIILRHSDSTYKHGRSSKKDMACVKIKPHQDAEGVLIGLMEKETNTNEATTNELGLSKRSTHKAGKVKAGELGAMIVEWEGKRFKIGSGFTAAQRKELWTHPPPMGSLIKFKFQELTTTNKVPRFPVYLGVRHKEDT